MNTFKETGLAKDPAEENKIMHSMLEAENGVTFMASDTPSSMALIEGSQVSMSLSGDEEETLRGYWEKLSEGGNVTVPLAKAPWGDTFGMLTDKFGIKWMVNITGKREKS